MMGHAEQAFLAAYDAHADAIYRHCVFRVFDAELAQDLTQETFLRAWKSLAEGAEIDNLRAFLYRVATNLVIDHVRKRKAVSLDAMTETAAEPGHDPRGQLAAVDAARRTVHAMQGLDASSRETVILRHVEGLSPKEIAASRGENENQVSVRLHRAIKQLRHLMDR